MGNFGGLRSRVRLLATLAVVCASLASASDATRYWRNAVAVGKWNTPEATGEDNDGPLDGADFVMWRYDNNNLTTLPNDLAPDTGPTADFGQIARSASRTNTFAEAAPPGRKLAAILSFAVAAVFATGALRHCQACR